jgi:virginiamycin A acetyltransferase
MILNIKVLRVMILEFFDRFRFRKKQYLWQKQNSHNHTFLCEDCEFNKIKVGKHTYGNLHVLEYHVDGERLEIGNYVSIADKVQFVLGGIHQTETFTTYPLMAKLIRKNLELDAMSKGPIIVEDEVWIGTSSMILSGVTIGRGAIIGAGSVVTKDVPPFSIVAGIPAKVIKMRYDENIRGQLKKMCLADFDDDYILKNIDSFYLPVQDFLDQIKK